MRLLIVEDNLRLGELLAGGLGRRGFSADIARRLADADEAMASASYDAIILDLGLPDGDGARWLAARRRAGNHSGPVPPALMLTARGGLEDRVAGLDAGADDYLVKPFAMEELAARLRALLRRPGPRGHSLLELGGLRFDVASRKAGFGGRALDLSRREADLLDLLLRRSGSVVTREAIENALYAFNEPVTPNAVEAVVSRLRRKLEDAGAVGLLHTIRGVGYMLKGDGA